jgi:hypothetical protein
MKKLSRSNWKALALLVLFLQSLGVSFYLSLPVEAINNIRLRAMNTTEIRLEGVTLSQTDWDNMNSRLKRVYPSVGAINDMLEGTFSNVRFFDRDIWDDNHNYQADVTLDGLTCGSSIDIDSPTFSTEASEVKLEIPTPADNVRSCENITSRDIPIQDPPNLRKAFFWVDETTIKAYQSGDLYLKASDSNTIYRRQSEDGDNCQDTIRLFTSGPNGTVDYGSGFWSELSGSPPCHFEDPWGVQLDGDGGQKPTEILIGNVENREVPAGQGAGGAGDAGEDLPSCESENAGVILSWFLCAVINFFDNMVQTMGNVVDDLLQVNREYYTNDQLRKSWAYFRNIASFMLIIIGLVMIIGQAVTKG